MRAKVTVNLAALRHNAKTVLARLSSSGIELCAVTKMHSADVTIARTLVECGVKILGDSRLENLARLGGIPAQKWLLRIPPPSLADDVVRLADLSLNSELSTIAALGQAALAAGKVHKVVLMVDLGDLREGFFGYGDLLDAARKAAATDGIELAGIGTNLSCYGGVMPTAKNMGELVQAAFRLRQEGFPVPIVSGGNSTSYSLLMSEGLDSGVNNLRIGDTIYLGRDMIARTPLPAYRQDVFTLTAEVVEVKTKPSYPIGELGYAALNQKPVFEDKGLRVRAILSAGKQDIDLDIDPIEAGVQVLGASSDHLILDVTEREGVCRPGDMLSFTMKYTAAMRAFTSEYVDIEYKDGEN